MYVQLVYALARLAGSPQEGVAEAGRAPTAAAAAAGGTRGRRKSAAGATGAAAGASERGSCISYPIYMYSALYLAAPTPFCSATDA